MSQIVDIFLHLDRHLDHWASEMGPWLYVVLFAIVFCETGLVVTPFLPGDSLLFAVGALAATGSAIALVPVILILCAAGILGDAVNYAIGKRIGPVVFSREKSRLLNREHLMRAHRFYEKHGGKTIIIARFVPIIRTFAPFVAGIAKMGYPRFAAFNVIGGISWVLIFTLAGYWFGNQPFVKRNFQYVILAIIVISVIPVAVEFWRARRDARRTPTSGPA
jgi:membrane-associated protein